MGQRRSQRGEGGDRLPRPPRAASDAGAAAGDPHASTRSQPVPSRAHTRVAVGYNVQVKAGSQDWISWPLYGARIPIGSTQMQGTAMVVPIAKPLPPGAYRVNWHCFLSVDGHKVQGSFTFEVRP